MPQWTARQIHDTVAAITRQSAYAHGSRQSLLGRFFRFLGDQLSRLLDAVEGSLNARIVVGLAVAAIVFVIVARIIVDRRLAEARQRTAGGRVRPGERPDFRRIAGDAAERGDFAEACHALHAAVLDEIARAGVVKWHASKTNGDYARELQRRKSPLHAAFRAFARDFERMAFGTRTITRDDYLRLRAAADAVDPRRIAA